MNGAAKFKKRSRLTKKKSILLPEIRRMLSLSFGISDDRSDVPVRDDSSTFDALNDDYEILSNSNDDDTLSDDDDFEDVEYEEVNDVDQEEKEFETFSDHTEETRIGSTTTHANYSLRQLPKFESFHFDPSFPRPPPEPPDVEICLYFEPDAPVIDNFNELNYDKRGSEINFSEDDDSFTFVIRTFLPFLTYPEDYPDFEDSRALGTGYQERDENNDKIRQNRARDQKEYEKTSPTCLRCYLCGDPLDGILCRRCSCGWCGNKLDDGFCSYCASKDGNAFAYDPNPNSFDNSPNFSYPPPQPQFETYSCELCGNDSHYGYDCPSRVPLVYEPEPYSVDCQEALDKILEELKEIKQDRRKKIEDMSIEEMRHEQQLVDYKIKDITNDLGIKRFRAKFEKKEQAYEEEKYSAARRRMLSIPFVDEDDYIPLGDIIARYSTSKAITPDLSIEEPDNSLSMGDEHLDTTPSIENVVPIPSEFEDISDDTSDVPTCDNNRVSVEIDFVESLIDRDTSIVYTSKIDPILEEFAGELAHIAPIPSGIVEADFDPDDGTSSDNDDYEDVEYEEVNDVEQEEKEFNLEDIFQIQDVILREKLLNVHRLITNIESLNNNPTPDCVLNSPSSFPFPVADRSFHIEALSEWRIDELLDFRFKCPNSLVRHVMNSLFHVARR
ncbi:hypothetical protein Tco_0261986 [Tanacetum coccineum]